MLLYIHEFGVAKKVQHWIQTEIKYATNYGDIKVFEWIRIIKLNNRESVWNFMHFVWICYTVFANVNSKEDYQMFELMLELVAIIHTR